MTFNFSTEVRVRLPETDAMGIVFHGAFFTFLDVGRMDYLRNLGVLVSGGGTWDGPIEGFANVVVRAACDFRSPARFDDLLVVKVRVAALGRSSFRFASAVTHKRENRLVAMGESTHVAVDAESWAPIPVPEDFRRAVRAFEGESLVEAPTGPDAS